MFDIFNPVNMLDPIRKRFGYGHLWPLRPVFSQNRAGSYNYAEFDFPHPIRFRSSKEGLDHNFIVQNRAGSDLDGLFRVLPNASGPEASRCARIIGPGSGRTQPASFQFLHFQTWLRSFTDGPDHIVQNQLGSDLVLVDCQVLAKRNRSGSKPVCKDRPARFWLCDASEPIRIRSGVFTSMHTVVNATANGGCANTVRESAPKVDSGRKSLGAPGNQTRVSIGLNKMYSFIVIISSTHKYRKHKSSMLL